MKNFKISLTSIGFKMLSLVLSISLVSFTVVLFIFNTQMPWYAIGFSLFVTLFCLFGCFLCFNHIIVIDGKEKLLKIYVLKVKTIKLKEIIAIRVDTSNSINPKKYCFIVIDLKNGETYKTSEYSTLIKKNAVKITERKVKDLNEKVKIALSIL